MDRTHGEALSAFFDREQVDPELLAESLAQPGASALLSEFAVMRAEVLRDSSRPTPEFFERMAAHLKGSLFRRVWENRHARRALAASLLAGVGMGGFLLGSDSARHRVIVNEGPPRPTAVSTQAVALPQPPATSGGQPSVALPPSQEVGPPAASLRLRIGQWRDTPPPADEEGGRQ